MSAPKVLKAVRAASGHAFSLRKPLGLPVFPGVKFTCRPLFAPHCSEVIRLSLALKPTSN